MIFFTLKKSSVMIGVIEIAVPLSIFPEIPSGPEALLVSKAFKSPVLVCLGSYGPTINGRLLA